MLTMLGVCSGILTTWCKCLHHSHCSDKAGLARKALFTEKTAVAVATADARCDKNGNLQNAAVAIPREWSRHPDHLVQVPALLIQN